MMQFLRKYQKILFLMIAIMTMVSFAFFGTGNSFSAPDAPDKKLCHSLSGSPIYEKDVRALTQFLSIGTSEFMRSDFMETGVCSLLAERYFNDIKSSFQEKILKAQSSHFYSHPQASFLNAFQIWNRFAPQLVDHLRTIQTGEASPKLFSTYVNLYLDQQRFPPELLRTFLLYEQQNYGSLSPDYQLADPRHLALFGFHSFEEWFGPRFAEILSKFIINVASIAEQKGYKVSHKEARADFMMRCYEAARMQSLRAEVAPQDATDFMRFQLQLAGVDESRAIQLWRQVMLVHRYFQEMEQGVILDPIPYEQFSTFAETKASVEVYELPEELRLQDFRSMLEVQCYLEAVAPKSKGWILDLPRQFYSIEEVEKKCPQLVTSRYELEVAKVVQAELFSRLSLKQTWDFEKSDAGWSLIIAQFPVLNKKDGLTDSERELILDGCDPQLRKKIDRFVSQLLVKQHPEWVQEAIAHQSPQKLTVDIRSKGKIEPFNDIEDSYELRQLLQKCEIGSILTYTSEPHGTIYQVKVVQKPEKKEIMTLKAALAAKVLSTLLDEKLESAWIDVRKKDHALYKATDGTWKPFNEVKDHVGAYVYADLLQALSSSSLTYEEYAAHRFYKMMETARLSIQKEKETSRFLDTTGLPLCDQWRLVKHQKEIKRSDITELSKHELFSKNLGTWSSVSVPKGGNLSFFYLLGKENSEVKIMDQVAEGQKLIGRDSTRYRMQTLMEELLEQVGSF